MQGNDSCVDMLLQLPQYYRNYKTKSADALSPWFLAQWLLVSVDAATPTPTPEVKSSMSLN
jgi:hypothetical protein